MIVRELYVVGKVAFIPHPNDVRVGRIRVWMRVHACVEITCSYCGADVGEPCKHVRTKRWSTGTHVARRAEWTRKNEPDAPRNRTLRLERDLRLGGRGAK